MISTDFLDIDNGKLITRLLPIWAKGKKIQALLLALLSPLETYHNQFKAWATDRYIECHITAQSASLEWYLTYKLRKRFLNPSDKFIIAPGSTGRVACFSGRWINQLYWHNDMKWGEMIHRDITTSDIERDTVTIYAPKVDFVADYTSEDYEKEIMNILSRFATKFCNIQIRINNNT